MGIEIAHIQWIDQATTNVGHCHASDTIIPSIALVTAAAAIVQAGSYFKCWRAGDNGTNSLGAWT